MIGKDNDLIWRLRNDLQRFKALTSGHCIIMGRKTFESFPKPLPNRTHIVITRQQNYSVTEGVNVVNSLESAIEAAKLDSSPYIIGGGEIYKLALEKNLIDRIYLTRVNASFEGDTLFPKLGPEWELTHEKKHPIDEKHSYSFSIQLYEKSSLFK